MKSNTLGRYHGKIPWENFVHFDNIKKMEYYKSSRPKISCPQEIHNRHICILIWRSHTNHCVVLCFPATWMDPSNLGSQPILLSIDPTRSLCHRSPQTYGLWYHLNPPSFSVPKGTCCNIPLAKSILLRVIQALEYQLIISWQSISWEWWMLAHVISLLCWCCSMLNSCCSTRSPRWSIGEIYPAVPNV